MRVSDLGRKEPWLVPWPVHITRSRHVRATTRKKYEKVEVAQFLRR